MISGLNERIADLKQIQSEALKVEWERLFGTAAPKLSPTLLRLGLAWQLQASALGGHSREVQRLLRTTDKEAATRPASRRLTPGTRLVRDWHGEGHTVTVLESGFEYDGKTWRSLTAIARHITGAKWSGPRFFGLTG